AAPRLGAAWLRDTPASASCRTDRRRARAAVRGSRCAGGSRIGERLLERGASSAGQGVSLADGGVPHAPEGDLGMVEDRAAGIGDRRCAVPVVLADAE